jgi:hypothetical protein
MFIVHLGGFFLLGMRGGHRLKTPYDRARKPEIISIPVSKLVNVFIKASKIIIYSFLSNKAS